MIGRLLTLALVGPWCVCAAGWALVAAPALALRAVLPRWAW